MTNDLLSESVNNVLDDVETTLCLPILILIILCTLQFIIYDFVDICCTLYQAIRNFSATSPTRNNECIVNRIKGVLKGCAKQVVGMSGKGTKSNESIEIRRQDEWDLCDEDDDDY